VTRTGQLELDMGLARAAERAPEWTRQARAWVLCLEPGERFWADDIRDEVGDPPGSGNAIGAVLRHLSEAGWIQAVGWRVSERPERHGAVLRVWERR